MQAISTQTLGGWGRIRIDVRNKDRIFARNGTAVIGLKTINVNNNDMSLKAVNSNVRPVALAIAA